MPRAEHDAQFNDRIRTMEHKITSAKHTAAVEKKPKDLLRAIGRIESNDWNIREIEKKIELSKKTEVGKNREKVPKWSKEQFLQRQNKMAQPLEPGAVADGDERFRDIDQTIRNLDKQLRDGSNLERGERGKNKVASIAAGTFGEKLLDAEQNVADAMENRSAERSDVQKSVSPNAKYVDRYHRCPNTLLPHRTPRRRSFSPHRTPARFATSAGSEST